MYIMPPNFFFFNDTPTTQIYTLSLHDALPISASGIGYAIHPIHVRRMLSALESCPDRAREAFEKFARSEEHTSELQSHSDLVCRLLLEKKNNLKATKTITNKNQPSIMPLKF